MRKQVLIAGVNSGIGSSLARLYRRDKWDVSGTYRTTSAILSKLEGVNLHLLDVTDPASIEAFKTVLAQKQYGWDLLILSIGLLEPIGNFFKISFDDWQKSFDANFFGQLRLLHEIHRLHRPGAAVAFFTGGAPNGVLENFSAYSIAKIALTKTVEYLDVEDKEINYFIVGPGWVKSNIHAQTMQAGNAAGANYGRTREFLGRNEAGTPLEDIYGCINWLKDKGRPVAGGRNFSVVWDHWGTRAGSVELERALAGNPQLYKLRRVESGRAG